MSLKMKFIATALAFGAATVNAQSYDYKKEFAENPEGAKAASCAAIFIFNASGVERNDPRYNAYMDSALAPLAAADKAYRDPKVSSNKINDAGMYFVQGLSDARLINEEESYLGILENLTIICNGNHPK